MSSLQYQPSRTEPERSRTRASENMMNRRYHPYRRNVPTLQKTSDTEYRAIYETSIPVLGMAKFPVEGVVEFRVPPAPSHQGRVERILRAVLDFVVKLRRKAMRWLCLRSVDDLPHPGLNTS